MDKPPVGHRKMVAKRKERVAQLSFCNGWHDAEINPCIILFLTFQIYYSYNRLTCIFLPERKNGGHFRRKNSFVKLAGFKKGLLQEYKTVISQCMLANCLSSCINLSFTCSCCWVDYTCYCFIYGMPLFWRFNA